MDTYTLRDMASTPTLSSIRARLSAVGQEHLLNFYAELSPAEQRSLLEQIDALEIELLPQLVEDYVKTKPEFALPPGLGPAKYYPRNAHTPGHSWDEAAAKALGEKLLRAGKVAGFVVAGGQGSRLGFEGPKGCYGAGCVSNKSLFELFAQHFAGAAKRYGAAPMWFIMTSPLNHQATVEFFAQHNYFGLSQRNITFFPQGVMPSLDITNGKVMLTSKGSVATNPDGHGGAIRALAQSGSLAEMRRRGIEHISYFQVDNPLVKVFDPVFIGLHAGAADSSGEMSSKMIPKAYPEEKMGIFCTSGGRTEVIEYSDLPMDLQRERLPDGTLRFIAGSIAIHLIGVEFLERVAHDPKFALPFHRAEKKIPCIDPTTGAAVNPTSNNGVKLEKFVFDALSVCGASIVYETSREEEFGPIKNATGVDSVETSKAMQTARAAAWLAARGVAIPRDSAGVPRCSIEISAETATCAQELSDGAVADASGLVGKESSIML